MDPRTSRFDGRPRQRPSVVEPEPIVLNGKHLTIEQLVAIAQHCHPFELDKQAVAELRGSRDTLDQAVNAQEKVYGVNTNFGGNATSQNEATNSGDLLQGLLVGILPLPHPVSKSSSYGHTHNAGHSPSHSLPPITVRAAMILRVNTFLRGRSGVRWALLEQIKNFVDYELTPIVPAQGSISASGDLSSLAYVAYALAGHPAIKIQKGVGELSSVMSADKAISREHMRPFVFGPKDVLGLINGTSASAAMAAHAAYQAELLLLLTQALTAMATEAMLGHKGAFDAVLHEEHRPHPGSVRVAHSLRHWLAKSNLLQDNIGMDETTSPVIVILLAAVHPMEPMHLTSAVSLARNDNGSFLKQDRYPIRTAPQWIGPVVEDYRHARETLEIEMNSITDNPIFDSQTRKAVHGGNFQATAVTNATEKTRDGLSYLGRLLFAQQSELLNVSMSNGLEPCLAPFDGPSDDGGLKGIDIANAAYTAELGFLANRMGHFNQSAEMHNQSINSLALISAGYTMQAVEAMTKLAANAVYVFVQAIDLRLNFAHSAKVLWQDLDELVDRVELPNAMEAAVLAFHTILSSMMRNSRYDLTKRIKLAVQELSRVHQEALSSQDEPVAKAFISFWYELMESHCIGARPVDKNLTGRNERFEAQLQGYLELQFSRDTVLGSQKRVHYLLGDEGPQDFHHLWPCHATLRIYRFVRYELGIPMYDAASLKESKKCIGDYLVMIYNAIRDGRFRTLLEDLVPMEEPVREHGHGHGLAAERSDRRRTLG